MIAKPCRGSLVLLMAMVCHAVVFLVGCGASLDDAVPLAEIESPHLMSSGGVRPAHPPNELVPTIVAPLLTDLAKPAGESLDVHQTNIEKVVSFRWNLHAETAGASWMETLKSEQTDARLRDAAVRLVQNPVNTLNSGGTSVPEIIPTPKGEPDPKWKEERPADAPKKSSPEPEPSKKAPLKQEPMREPAQPGSKVAMKATAEPTKGATTNEAARKAEEAELGLQPEDYKSWEAPAVALVFTGNQHGYIEPCGCTGLERQKGGVARRFTFLQSLGELGWAVVPMDVGNQVRRFGRQAEIKLQQSVKALKEMDYQAVGFGPEDIRLGLGELLSVASGDSPEEQIYISANVVLFDPEYMPQQKVIQTNGVKIGVTSILDPKSLAADPGEELLVNEMTPSLKAAVEQLQAQSPDYTVLLFYGEEKAAKQLVRSVEGFDLVVVSGGYGEPTYQANAIEASKTKIIVTGNKGMYAGVVGLFEDASTQPTGLTMRYARVPLTHEFGDAPEMRLLMKDYQNQLRDVGLDGLGLLPPIPHPSGKKFVGTEACGKCHTEALEVWEGSAHAHATESIVRPPEDRGDVARHFDPECISCHVTGWNAQSYHPYATGYLSLESTAHLQGNGCENCHGPGAEHAAAEEKGSGVTPELRDQLRLAMQLPLERAREKCMTCHDLDNSPDFHEPDAFEDSYWPEVEHYGLE